MHGVLAGVVVKSPMDILPDTSTSEAIRTHRIPLNASMMWSIMVRLSIAAGDQRTQSTNLNKNMNSKILKKSEYRHEQD